MQLDAGQWMVIGLCGLLIVVYAGGYYVNRRVGERVVAWLHGGLRHWGRVTAGERLGGMATGGRLLVKDAAAPFHSIEAVFLLLPRENLIFWLFDLFRGRKDELILRVNLRFAPKKSILAEVSPRRDKDFQQAVEQENLLLGDANIRGFNIALAEKYSAYNEAMLQFLEQYGKQVIRLSIRKQAPHIILRVHLKALLDLPAEELFIAIQDLIKREIENRESKTKN